MVFCIFYRTDEKGEAVVILGTFVYNNYVCGENPINNNRRGYTYD